MPPDLNPNTDAKRSSSGDPSDEFLIAGMLGGDAAALNRLIERYDRLVRYTILRASADRCRQDPQWLESIASASWEGFVRSLRRAPDNLPRSASAYLVQIARNQCAGALRRAVPPTVSLGSLEEQVSLEIPAQVEEPIETLTRIELLEALRDCLGELEGEGRQLATQLSAITERRWKDAAQALGISESTLRSRWSRTLERLRRCVTGKTGKSFAPDDLPGD